jgi:hypothetical protein
VPRSEVGNPKSDGGSRKSEEVGVRIGSRHPSRRSEGHWVALPREQREPPCERVERLSVFVELLKQLVGILYERRQMPSVFVEMPEPFVERLFECRGMLCPYVETLCSNAAGGCDCADGTSAADGTSPALPERGRDSRPRRGPHLGDPEEHGEHLYAVAQTLGAADGRRELKHGHRLRGNLSCWSS